MTTRPQRVSKLAGTSSVRPSRGPQSDSGDVEASDAQAASAEPAPEPVSAPQEKAPQAKAGKTQLGIYMRSDNLQRAKRAHTATVLQTGTRFWSDFVEEAVMEKAARLEQEYNDSKPF